MSTFPALRKRAPSEFVSVGALDQINAGLFGTGSPIPGLSQVDPRAAAAIYFYHEGDLFTPGTGNYVWEPIFELTPLNTIWGQGFLRKPNTFNPIQPPQLFVQSTVDPNGIGGLQAGDIELQALLNPDGTPGPFSNELTYDSFDK